MKSASGPKGRTRRTAASEAFEGGGWAFPPPKVVPATGAKGPSFSILFPSQVPATLNFPQGKDGYT